MWSRVFRGISKNSVLNTPSPQLPRGLRLESLGDYIMFFETQGLSLTDAKTKQPSIKSPSNGFEFTFELNGTSENSKLEECLKIVQESGIKCIFRHNLETPQIPRTILDLEQIDQTCLSAGAELKSDHPGFNDRSYRTRRQEIADIAYKYKLSHKEVPFVKYNEREIETWNTIFTAFMPELEKHACQEYLDSVSEISKQCKFNEFDIPQISDINRYLWGKTKFQFMPVAGLLSGRDFLAHLAFRVFPSTQYIRHHSVPFYTPEPDIVHELIGHMPLFADPVFAEFSQEIGIASLGASEEELKKLSTCYWSSVEFGILLNSHGERKAYGAGVLSSLTELRNAMNYQTNVKKFEPKTACENDYLVTDLQPFYWYSPDFNHAKLSMLEYTQSMNKPIATRYENDEIVVSQKVKVLVSV